MATLYLLSYNNYYNRIVKQEENLSAYLNYAIPFSDLKTGIEGVNFNPNDGVDTEQIINWNNTIPDYLVVADNNDIRSRWFITEMARTRGGQYKLTLHRDVIVDNYINVLNAQIFVDKAKASDNDIAIYNKEPYKFNSIKQSETLLKDETGCAWIVGYLSQKDPTSPLSLSGNVKSYTSDAEVQYTYSDVMEYFSSAIFNGMKYQQGDYGALRRYYGYGNTVLEIPIVYRLGIIEENTYENERWIYSGNSNNATLSKGNTYTSSSISNAYAKLMMGNDMLGLIGGAIKLYNASLPVMKVKIDNIKSKYHTFKDWNTESDINKILEEDGKIIKDTTSNKYYIVNVEPKLVSSGYSTINNSYPSIYNDFIYVLENTTETYGLANLSMQSGSSQNFTIRYDSYYDYQIVLTELSQNMTYTIPDATTRAHLADAPYDMFCMPYENKAFFKNGVSIGRSNKFINLSAAMSIVSDLAGAGYVYDLQLLPYCPLDDNYITASGDIDIKDMAVGKILKASLELGWIMFCTQSKFSFYIEKSIVIDNVKSQHQLDNWRFNSPNWGGSYDFDVTLNKGLDYVDVDCTYKPYTPYIHVCPRFNSNGYYGYNNKDAIGLICGGDFSLPVVTDQWKTYEYQNKNYQNQFDRQIQNINTNYTLESIERGANVLTGIASGSASGAVFGSIAGPQGAVAGGIAGGVTSAIGGAADMILASKKKEEAVSYATDQFNYQIDNIKSLPYTLSKVSSLNNNNKLFPFIEHFSASEQEKQIFNNLIKWNGMTINRVDTLSTFIGDEPSYFSGRLIRIDIQEDFHMVAAIAQEISKGVFV